ncbi:hypothetical protein HPB47_018762 [Ixodes persulcatus]|uniref:Uncharacterized protein n=1 Tax=Ixodes persulcatus TaxID=34615 RepID=A0AC60QK45_IXOPE|nr:hypothetical protein HPB47_018762 [Ixodes persulcatus]
MFSARREACRARHLSRDELVDGLCMPVHECLQSLKDVGKLKFPLFCGVRILLPIVCCPQPQRSPPTTTTTSTTTTTTPTTTTSTTPAPPVMGPCQSQTGQPGTCIPLFDCKPLEEQVSQGKYPPICSIQMRIPYACCPRNETPQAEPIQADAVARAVKVSELVYENGLFCRPVHPTDWLGRRSRGRLDASEMAKLPERRDLASTPNSVPPLSLFQFFFIPFPLPSLHGGYSPLNFCWNMISDSLLQIEKS